eukprot:CAMPEP_0204231142 /NCGR_PEP_ID=MMETSP0361-20130328/88495_1 /ASSEMBLY_ACC=CAM_ASM_000343 /TAXON_ID=268821 /ORGANISM="Scrippsiella Hangoei, Strain SHTV-5" /LENGTH=55 /DNA_ID=CAMNT_0051200485 /DNA_START=263 /DNA_END=430 /DNA_ORIENTATION=-
MEWSGNLVRPMSPDSGGMEHLKFKPMPPEKSGWEDKFSVEDAAQRDSCESMRRNL